MSTPSKLAAIPTHLRGDVPTAAPGVIAIEHYTQQATLAASTILPDSIDTAPLGRVLT
ncbi:MAG: hypothetical protein M3443_15540 [Actinomycetota bacterium]|nr:hypothetical protein [Actinomycetota bacterium]